MRIVVGITGASGAIYGITLLQQLKKLQVETHLILSKWAEKTIELETPYTAQQVAALASYLHEENDLTAPVASGSYLHDGMVIAPCSMKTLSAVANGYSNNLIARAADVTIKEHRTLILMPRETPLNAVHLENMLKLDRAGAVILPPMPAFYQRPQTVEEIILHSITRVLDILKIKTRSNHQIKLFDKT